MKSPTDSPILRKLAPLAALQQLDLGQTASDQAQQQLDQQAQDQAVRQASEMYGIEHQRALLPGQVAAQDISNQAGQYHLAFDPTMDAQKMRMGEADIAAQPGKNAYVNSQAQHNNAETETLHAMLAAGEPTARVNSQNAQADALRSAPLMQYYTAGQPFPNGPKPPSGFIEAQLAKLGIQDMANPEVDKLKGQNAELSKLIQGGNETGATHPGGTSAKHPLASLALRGVLPDYPLLNAMTAFPANVLPAMFGEDAYNYLDKNNFPMDLDALFLSKSAKARRQAEKGKAKPQVKTPVPSQNPNFSTAFQQ